ncbi:hypothetical protein [Nonomuraea aridisoli]|nr:hypothetical protein [Nonomuraea aridisoli]
MMYGPPPPEYAPVPEYPRATSSPPIILLVSGLAALLGFLLGVFVGFGAGAEPDSSAPRVTVTVTESEPAPQDTLGTPPEATPPAQTPPAQTPPAQTPPGQTVPSQTPPGVLPPEQTAPGQPGLGETLPTGPAIDPASGLLRTFEVGTDIQPGTYRTTGPVAGFTMCYWVRMNATGGVIASGMPAGPASVTVQPADKEFHTGGCAEWTRV